MTIRTVSAAVLLGVALAECPPEGSNAVGNHACCWDCEYNRYCPTNSGCYKPEQPGCSGGLCPAPHHGPTPSPAPTPAPTPTPSPAPTPAPTPTPSPAPALVCPPEGSNAVGNHACCWDCEYNRYCPADSGCYKAEQPGCSGGLCPAPHHGPTPSPAPTPEPTPTPTPNPTPPAPNPPSPAPSSCGGVSRPAKPAGALDLNGVAWPVMCINKTEAHFFGIGDWGGDGLHGHTWNNPGKFAQRGGKVDGPDDYAQQYVARQMKGLAVSVDPDFVINAGDNFYPGSITKQCPSSAHGAADPTGQFGHVHYDVYGGPGLDGKPWLSVLGNHDYGGRSFEEGWDVQIFHTWHSDTWVMPAQYWTQPVKYDGFSVEFFMLDSNFMDALPYGVEPNHNICQDWHHTNADCWGITNANCASHFRATWQASLNMLEQSLAVSTAEWKIILTHFPGPSIAGQPQIQRLNSKYGIDMIFTGHTHYQQHGEDHGIPWIISGGGGGVSSDGVPFLHGWDTAYGFVDFTVTRNTLKFDMHSWGGMGNDGSKPIITDSKTLRKERGVKVVDQAAVFV